VVMPNTNGPIELTNAAGLKEGRKLTTVPPPPAASPPSRAQSPELSVLSALVPASIASSMKARFFDFQAASRTRKTVAVRRRKWNLR
jgi:hypothetical protein